MEIRSWIDGFIKKLNEKFAERIWFVGLQGSYGRGEATNTSDIDIVVIIDELSADDIIKYNSLLDTLPNRELICGFLSGKDDIFAWEPSDLFQFYHDTTPIIGSLEELKTLIDDSVVDRAIKIGACNIYHGCVHNMLHEKSDEILQELYKSASFVIQAITFKQTGSYIKYQKEMLSVVSDGEKAIVERFLRFKNGEAVDFAEASQILFTWAKKWILET